MPVIEKFNKAMDFSIENEFEISMSKVSNHTKRILFNDYNLPMSQKHSLFGRSYNMDSFFDHEKKSKRPLKVSFELPEL